MTYDFLSDLAMHWDGVQHIAVGAEHNNNFEDGRSHQMYSIPRHLHTVPSLGTVDNLLPCTWMAGFLVYCQCRKH